MAKTVSITLTGKGADAGPFNITSHVGTSGPALQTVASNVALVVDTPVQYTNVDESATYIKLTSTGVCTNYVFLAIQ